MRSISTSDQSPLRSIGSGEAVESFIYFDPARQHVGSSFYDTLENATAAFRISHRLIAAEGLGRSGRIRNDTTAELDPPAVIVAADTATTINAILCSAPVADVLVTLAPVEIVVEGAEALERLGFEPAELVVHCRHGSDRDDRQGVGGIVEELRRHGIAGATALGRGQGTIAGTATDRASRRPRPTVR